MYLSKLITILMLLFSSTVFSVEENACTPIKDADDLEFKVNDNVSYFFKVHPDGEYLVFISDESNRMINLGSGEIENIPGSVDPVFSPDGKYLTIPIIESHTDKNGDLQHKSKMGFYNFQNIKELGHGAKPEYEDEENNGVYQSIGLTAQGGYRLITDKDGATINDHSHLKEKISRSESSVPCSNSGEFATDLPMISKDGRFLSVLDSETDTTKIFRISPNGDCELAADLGFSTGKVSFNHDSSQITFHVDHISDPYEGGYFQSVDMAITKDVYVMNLDEIDGKLIPRDMAKVTSTGALEQGAYYPEFDKQGNIYYVRDTDDYFSFHRTAQENLEFFDYDPYLAKLTDAEASNSTNTINVSCYDSNQRFFQQVALGALWSEVCLKSKARLTDYYFFAKGIDPNKCEMMIEANWNKEFIKILMDSQSSSFEAEVLGNISIEELKAVCPSKVEREVDKKVVGEWEEKVSPKDHKEIINTRCVMCHQAEMTYEKEFVDVRFVDENGDVVEEVKIKESRTMPSLKIENLDDMPLEEYARLVAAVSDPNPETRMPRGGSLSDDEQSSIFQGIQNYLFLGAAADEVNAAIIKARRAPKVLYKTSEKYLNEQLETLDASIKESFSGVTDKNAVDNYRKFYANRLRCTLRRENCSEYIKQAAYQLTATELNKYDLSEHSEEEKNQITQALFLGSVQSLRCELYYEVTRSDCE